MQTECKIDGGIEENMNTKTRFTISRYRGIIIEIHRVIILNTNKQRKKILYYIMKLS